MSTALIRKSSSSEQSGGRSKKIEGIEFAGAVPQSA